MHILLLVTDNGSEEGRRMVVEIISRSIFTKVWVRAEIELPTPGSADILASVTRHITDCACGPGIRLFSSADFFKINFNKKEKDVHEHYFSVNQFTDRYGSKVFANFINTV